MEGKQWRMRRKIAKGEGVRETRMGRKSEVEERKNEKGRERTRLGRLRSNGGEGVMTGKTDKRKERRERE